MRPALLLRLSLLVLQCLAATGSDAGVPLDRTHASARLETRSGRVCVFIWSPKCMYVCPCFPSASYIESGVIYLGSWFFSFLFLSFFDFPSVTPCIWLVRSYSTFDIAVMFCRILFGFACVCGIDVIRVFKTLQLPMREIHLPCVTHDRSCPTGGQSGLSVSSGRLYD